jgi:hypothetical protein
LSTSLSEIESVPALHHQWVAIDPAGGPPIPQKDATPLRLMLRSGAMVIDADPELDVLCRRLSAERRTSLTIVYAG